jgi:hypothetical protein
MTAASTGQKGILERFGSFAGAHEEDGGSRTGLRHVRRYEHPPGESAGIVERVDPDELDPSHRGHRMRRYDRSYHPRLFHRPYKISCMPNVPHGARR